MLCKADWEGRAFNERKAMNKERRKALGEVIDAVEALKAKVSELVGPLNGLREEIEGLKDLVSGPRDEEQEYYDGMPESIQNGDKGSTAQEAIDALDEVDGMVDEITEAIDALDNVDGKFDEIISKIDEARGTA